MNAMEAMAVNVLGKMLGMTQEEMAGKVGDFGATLNEFVSRLEAIENNTAEILRRMEASENVNGSGSGKRGSAGRRLAAPDAGQSDGATD